MATKTCTKCMQKKDLTEFHKAPQYRFKNNFDGHDYYCKYCRTGANLASQHNKKRKCSIEGCENPHYAKTYCRMHYTRVARTGSTDRKIQTVEVEKPYLYEGTEVIYRRDYHLRSKYKMTLEQFQNRSKNGCEVCNSKPEAQLHVDHNHSCCDGPVTCGKCVRGIVCNRCNTAIEMMETGKIRPDYPLFDKIKQYLEKYA